MLPVILEMNAHYRIEHQEGQRNYRIVDTIHQEGLPGSSHIGHPVSVDNKSGNMPGHNEEAHATSQQQHTHKADVTKIFRSEKKCGSTECGGKVPSQGQYQYQPECQQELVASKMKDDQLHRQEIIKIVCPMPDSLLRHHLESYNYYSKPLCQRIVI